MVNRSIEALAKESNVEGLRVAKARIPALWSLHQIPGKSARAAVRGFLMKESSDVRVAAIHSVALWRDSVALKPLIEILASDDALLRRLAAMALGRIGDRMAVQPLLEAGLAKTDPFLKHAIIYAMYEIGDLKSLPGDHPMTKQVGLMHQVAKSNPSPHLMPEI